MKVAIIDSGIKSELYNDKFKTTIDEEELLEKLK